MAEFIGDGRERQDASTLPQRYTDVFDMLSKLRRAVEVDMVRLDGIEDTPGGGAGEGVASDVAVCLNKHYYDSTLTVEKVSHIFGFNLNYISQLFKKAKNEKYTAYLTRIRMAHACELLEKKGYSISVIAEKVGYTEYFYFAKVFRRMVGESPGD